MRIIFARSTAWFAVLAAAFASSPSGAGAGDGDVDLTRSPFVDPATLDPNVPAPETIIGHEVGAKAVRYDDLVRYLFALAEASDHVVVHRHGETHEGRALYHLTITSEANHARLDDIRAANAKLADPRTLEGPGEAKEIIADLPGIAWLAYSIHGDEVSPCDSAMVVAYRLAAGTDEATERMRDELVVHVDPLQNPDGRERFLAQIESLRGVVPNPDIAAMHHAGLWSAGRGNHYLFDLNRDWLPQVHPETRGRTAAILAWSPHLLVDSHEMGGLDTYLFEPPREPLNLQMAPHLLEWRKRVSADHAAAFDAFGWSYYSREWYEEWYPGYTNAWGTLIGAIGILYEQAGVTGDAVTQRAGNVLTYREAVHHNVVSSFANLETLRANRQAILTEHYEDRALMLTDEAPFHGFFLFPPARDGARLARLLDVLDRHAIEYERTAAPIRAEQVVGVFGKRRESEAFPAGTVVVSSRQPQQRLLHAALDFDPRMTDSFLQKERHELENRRGSLMYDVSAWNLPMAYGLEAYRATRVAGLERQTADELRGEQELDPEPPAFGYLVPFDDSTAYPFLARVLAAGARPRAARKPFTIAGRSYRRGTLLLRRNENPDDLLAILRAAAEGLPVTLHAVETARSEDGPDLGGREFPLLHEPRVAIASQWPTRTTSFGATWFLLDRRVGLRSSPINLQALRFIDLRKYNVLILPSSSNLAAVLGEGGLRRLRTWVEGGGTLIALGGSAAALADEKAGLSSVRRRRDALDELDVYEEWVERELAARSVAVDPESVWGAAAPGPAEREDDEDQEHEKTSGDADARRRADEWARVFSPGGAIVAGRLDPEHWLCFGLDERLPLLVSGSTALLSKHPVRTPVRIGGPADFRLSGLIWPEARPRLARSAYATVERVGNGQVILFINDPFFRGYWEGTGRLLLNAVMLGPGMGASQPVPW